MTVLVRTPHQHDASTPTIDVVANGDTLDDGGLDVSDRRIHGFRLLEKLGRGGCSTVYLAERERDDHRVALKVLHPGLASSSKQVQRLFQEAQALDLISHPAIVQVYEWGFLAPDRPYLCMELIQGETLTHVLERSGRITPEEALEILTPICDALNHAHRIGIVHRDIKAGNVLITERDGHRVVKLVDFGVAKLLHRSSERREFVQTSVGMVVGSLHSLAPEQISGLSVDGRTDVYALGVLLFKMLTGRHPFHGIDQVSLMQMHLRAPPPLPSLVAAVPATLDAVVCRAMAKRPEDRYQTALAMLHDIEAAVKRHSDTGHGERSSLVWAIYVDARPKSDGSGREPEDDHPDEIDDELLMELLDVVDCAAYELQNAGLQILMQTDHGLLAATPIATESGQVRDRAWIIALAQHVLATLGVSESTESRIRVNLCVHRCGARFGNATEPTQQPDMIGGEVFDVDRWAPTWLGGGLQVTRQVLDDTTDPKDVIEHVAVDQSPRS